MEDNQIGCSRGRAPSPLLPPPPVPSVHNYMTNTTFNHYCAVTIMTLYYYDVSPIVQ